MYDTRTIRNVPLDVGGRRTGWSPGESTRRICLLTLPESRNWREDVQVTPNRVTKFSKKNKVKGITLDVQRGTFLVRVNRTCNQRWITTHHLFQGGGVLPVPSKTKGTEPRETSKSNRDDPARLRNRLLEARTLPHGHRHGPNNRITQGTPGINTKSSGVFFKYRCILYKWNGRLSR